MVLKGVVLKMANTEIKLNIYQIELFVLILTLINKKEVTTM